MSGDRVFATVKSDEVFVFRHNFSANKWENFFTNRADGSATVTFRKRGYNFFVRIVGDGGLRVGLDPISVLCASRLSVSAGGAPVVYNCPREGFW